MVVKLSTRLYNTAIVFGLVRLAARLQWSKNVELPQAVEFRQAMEKMGIHDPDDRIDFVRRHGVPVYIAAKPFIGMERELVKARLYAFSDSLYIGNKEVFNAYTGQQRLCLDGEDYKIPSGKIWPAGANGAHGANRLA